MSAAARDPLPDALRALALVGVLLVNAMGYAWAPDGPLLGFPEPAGSTAALALIGIVATLLQGKAYPVLALLFGAGLALAQRERTPEARQRAHRRRTRLLGLGLLHGTVLYFGDILTLYALVAPFVLRHVHEPWRLLRPRLVRALGWAVAATVVLQLISLMPDGPPGSAASLATAPDLRSFVRINAAAFWSWGPFSLLFGFPVVRLCMLVGVAVVRLRLLTHRRWRRWRGGLVRYVLPVALLANLGYAALVVQAAMRRQAPPFWVDVGSTLVCLPLSAGLLAAAAAWLTGPAGRRASAVLAPLGRRTLTLYVGHALWCLIVYADAGLGWRPGTVGIVSTSLGLWLAVAFAAHRWPGTWPLEAWMGRRT